MARYSGLLGFYQTVEMAPGVWEDKITEHHCTGSIDHISRRYGEKDSIDRDITVTMAVSMIMNQNFDYSKVRYITYNGVRWAVNTIEFKRPRVTLHFGGIWNGQD